MTIPVFDGHNDFLLRLLHLPDRRATLWPDGDGSGHIDLRRLQSGRFSGGLFAMFVPSPRTADGQGGDDAMEHSPYDVPLAAPVGHAEALQSVRAMAAHLHWMERASEGQIQICRSVREVRACQQQGRIAAVLHLEGAESIDPEFAALDELAAWGLRSLGLVWSRPNIFGNGVPFRFPSSPDVGSGLTDLGKRLVAECNRRRILIDLSHLNAAGFADVARLSDAPLVASHSCAHAITESSRNLTDRQLGMIADSGGLVGLNFATILLRRDGRRSPVMGWSAILRHLDHLIARVGEDHVGFGSDFDGTTVPGSIKDVTGLASLQAALRAHGYDTPLLRKLCHENWHGVLERTWGC